MRRWLTERIGLVRVRQLLDSASHRLAFVPIAMLVAAIVLAQVTLAIDRWIGDTDLPAPLGTTAASARSIFGAIAGGLITATTLLVSMMLVAVQLASGQFSPRTLRNWLGDTTLRRAVGIVLATTTFCLMGLRSIRSVGEGAFEPTVTALTAVVLGIVSLVAVIRAVDHVTQSLQIGTVAQRLVDDTLATIEADASGNDGTGSEQPGITPAARPVTAPTAGAGDTPAIPDGAIAIEAPRCGWIQQIDEVGILAALADPDAGRDRDHDRHGDGDTPRSGRVWVTVVHGGYVTTSSPLAWIDLDHRHDDHRHDDHRHDDHRHDDHRREDRRHDGALDDELMTRLTAAFAIGPTRTMQRDVGFGLAQLSDIAVRALSPGVNDPQTAQDVVVHLGEVMRGIWSHPRRRTELQRDGSTVFLPAPTHEEYLHAAFDPIRRYGRHDPAVLGTIARTLHDLRAEVRRRDLAGPIEPISAELADLVASADDTGWLDREREELRRLVEGEPARPGTEAGLTTSVSAAAAPGTSPA